MEVSHFFDDFVALGQAMQKYDKQRQVPCIGISPYGSGPNTYPKGKRIQLFFTGEVIQFDEHTFFRWVGNHVWVVISNVFCSTSWIRLMLNMKKIRYDSIELTILFFFEHVLIMKYMDEHCIILSSLLGIFVAPKPQVHCPQNGWICWRSKWRSGRKSDRHIDILEMHVMQRTTVHPQKLSLTWKVKMDRI